MTRRGQGGGGRRPGAGRPPNPNPVPTARRSIVLERDLIERATALGDGNFTEGLRRAIRRATGDRS